VYKEIIETGKTVDEAIGSACEKLGCDRDDVSFEIIDLPKKVMLGLKLIPAKVKVWVGEAEVKTPAASAPEKKPTPPPSGKEPAPRRAVEEKPKTQRPEARTAEPTHKPHSDKDKFDREEKTLEMTPEIQAKTDLAISYLSEICKNMDLTVEFQSKIQGGGMYIDIQGKDLGILIGKHGDALDSLQYLAGLVANRLEGEYLRITLDCGDYRSKRAETLRDLARKLAAGVIRTNTSKMLEPMNPFERRIIHAEISEIPGVNSTSIGDEPYRKVLITTPTSKRGSDFGGRGGRNDRRDRSSSPPRRNDRNFSQSRRSGPPRRDNRDRPESTMGGSINTMPQNRPAPTAPTAAPKTTPEASGALYTKLDLE